MKLNFESLREHGVEHYRGSCAMRWFSKHGLDWRVFLKEGYDHTEMLAAAGSEDPELNTLLEYHGLSIEKSPLTP